jgi:hypothetical protein
MNTRSVLQAPRQLHAARKLVASRGSEVGLRDHDDERSPGADGAESGVGAPA